MGEIGISRSCLNRKVAYMQDSKGGYFNWSKRGTWGCCADGHYILMETRKKDGKNFFANKFC